ncbi:uncharacterized protein LOC113359850 [Papaver somniferum]|uniref:uncharacterized protein LOC113359850 n=1 Tax=Papaver somniferum TaxID=3469 RepID=UPI000E6FAD98|nr:uncharacterized protein LOC113359850 [Papaver somniferum]
MEVLNEILQVRNWVYNFRPASQELLRQWYGLPGLGLEFWNEKILFTICKEIGTPLKIDNTTARCEVGYYANVLVEVDFSQHIPSKVWIGTKYGGFFQDVMILDCPKFCSSYSVVDSIKDVVQTNSSNVESISQGSKFSALENVPQEEVLEEVIMETPKIVKVVEANTLSNSTVKFINGTNGKVEEVPIQVTSWSKVVEKEMVTSTSTSTSDSVKAHKIPNASSKPQVISVSSPMLTVSIGDVLVSGVHAHVKAIHRRFLSSEMKIISDLNKPWIILGDFNAILTHDEKVGGRVSNRNSMLEFNDCLNQCELLQAPKTGLQYSWSNCQHGRGCANLPKPKNTPRKFQKIWLSHPEFMQVVSNCWSKNVVGDPAFQFLHKLKELKKVLNTWNWEVFGDVQVKIKEATNKVNLATQISDANPFDEDALANLVQAQNEHASREIQANTLMRQKARVKWIKEGSANTIFFHTKMKIRNAKNMISELEDNDGNIIADQDKIAEALVDHFQKKFEFQPVNEAKNFLDIIPKIITEEDQQKIDIIPEEEEIKAAIFDMDPESAPGPDGFSGIFFRSCWNIIKNDLVAAIKFCWRRRFILKGMNSSFLFLLPKTQGAKTANLFRPIGLRNVVFKIFTKIITKRMSELMEKLISPQQAAYIEGRNIHEQVLMASELVNEMKFTRRGGNVGIKLDISQAYDSVSWDFLIKFLLKYGFSESWCEWLIILFKSARISVLVNGGPCGFFSMGRGLRQGYPLSPILFVLMEDVLSRNISALVERGEMQPMVMKNGIHPTHLFFADDVFIFCNGGKVTSAMVWHIVEVLQRKLAAWKVYRWPSSVIKICEKTIRNFLWTGDEDTRKFKTLSWKKVCTPYEEGGLGIRRLKVVNQSLLMKLMWRILNSDEEWALFLSAKFQNRYGQWTSNWRQSIICKGLKWAWNALKDDIRWKISDGSHISVWFDIWLGENPLINDIGYTEYVKHNIGLKVNALLSEGQWNIPVELQQLISNYHLPAVHGGVDIRLWNADNGNFSTHSAVERIRYHEPVLSWTKYILQHFLHPSIASNVWKLQQEVYVDDVIMMKRGFEKVSICCICCADQDNMNHTLWDYEFSVAVWGWLTMVFGFPKPKSFADVCQVAKHKGKMVKQMWMTTACATMKEMWFHINAKLFGEIKPNLNRFKSRIIQQVHEGSYRMTASRPGLTYESQIILESVLY